jgi:enterochelin esterase-like enzyme
MFRSPTMSSLLLWCFLLVPFTTSTYAAAYTSKSTTGRNILRPPIVRRRQLTPPFPNGSCGGKVITIPPEDTYGIDVNLADINLGGDFVLPPRPIQVWLPPDYNISHPAKQHPVLYAHDGHNAMEDTQSWTGTSWRLMGALTRLVEYGLILQDEDMPMPIVVMLPSAEGDLMPGVRRRHLEYGDTNLPFAKAHADFVAKTVKPLIDSRFATNPAAEHTFTIGTSLGGQASMHLLLRHPDLFGGAACLSPSFGSNILDEVARSSDALESKRIYLDIGGDVKDVKVPFVDLFDHMTPEHWWNPGYFWLDTQLQGSVTAMRRALDQAGVDYCFQEFPGGRHNERAWAQRIDKPLQYLYEKRSDTS